MRHWRAGALLVAVAAVAVVAVAVAGAIESGPPAAAGERVLSVADGDTLRLASGERVRLVQVDAPELGGTECYSARSLGELTRLAPPGSSVSLVRDPALDDSDRFGRLLRYVVVGGTNVNLELVRRGAATPYFYRGDRGRYAAELLAAARAARAAKRGLWGVCPGTRLAPTRAAATG